MNVIELLSRPDSLQPGGVGGIRQPPVMIKQRPFKPTQFKVPKPPVASVNPNRVKPPVFATGIPLPQLLIPEGDFNQVSPKPQATSPVKIKTETLKKPTSNVVDTEKKVEGPLKISVPKLQNAFVIPSNKNGKRPLTASGSNNMDFNFPGKGVSLDELLNNLSQEDDEDIEVLEELLEGTQLFTFDEGDEELEDNDDLVNLEDLSALQLPLPVPARGLQPKDPGITF